MKDPAKLTNGSSTRFTRAGLGGRKQAQTQIERDLDREASIEAGLTEEAHQARPRDGAVEDGTMCELHGGAADLRNRPATSRRRRHARGAARGPAPSTRA